MLSPWRQVSYGLMFIEGAVSPLVNMCGYVYMCEFLTKKWQDYLATIYCFIYASVVLILTFYFQVISNRYEWIMLVGLIQLLISVTLAFFIVESPIWDIKKGRIYQAQVSCRAISRINNVLSQAE